jgi:hypothetical protein
MKYDALACLAVLVASCAHPNTGAPPTSLQRLTPEAQSGIARLREATKSFRVLDSAVAAGYAPTVAACLVHEHHGAMGYHHNNPKLADAKAEIERPEILLYERMPNGEYRLNGVEYIVPYRAWPRDTVGPTIMGQRMKREDNLKFWYLHAWAWSENADGMFSDFNPSVRCGADRRVFKPYEQPPV